MPLFMVTLPELSVLKEVCQEVAQPMPKMPGWYRLSIDDPKVRPMASGRLPGVNSEASTAEASVAVGKSSLA